MNNTEHETRVYGNYQDKYHSTKGIAKILISNFLGVLQKNLARVGVEDIQSICEVGCGEGEILKLLHSTFPFASLHATDISDNEVAKARNNLANLNIHLSIQDAENLSLYQDDMYDLVVCVEVLEHLNNPIQGFAELRRISHTYALISVPNEPIWRILNMSRGKYLRSFGNTPGHLNHWTRHSFTKFLKSQSEFSIEALSYPFPWQMALLRKKTD